MQFDKIGRSSVTEETIEYLKDQILSQKLKPGQQLPGEENLASQLGVGRGTVREALRVLVYLGFIERHNKATTVTSIAASPGPPQEFLQRIAEHRDVIKLFEVRKIIEPEAAALAAKRADEGDIAEIERQLSEMDKHFDTLEEFAVHDERFHLALFRCSGNEILVEIMMNVQRYMHQNQVQILRLSHNIKPRSLEFHRRICAAVSEGRAEDAREAMKAHMLHIEQEMFRFINTGKNETQAGGK